MYGLASESVILCREYESAVDAGAGATTRTGTWFEAP